MIFYGNISAKHAVLFLHGFTQSATNARNKLKLSLPNNTDSVYFFPSRKWFLYKDDDSFFYDESSLYKARKYVHKILNTLYEIYDTVKLIGYSQGACLALDVALTYKRPIQVLSISGFIMNYEHMETYNYTSAQNIWIAHGEGDSIIPLNYSYNSFNNCKFKIRKFITMQETDHWDFWENSILKDVICEFVRV